MTVYAFGLEEHVYDGTGVNQSNTYYYSLHDRLIGKTNGITTQFFLSDELGSVLTTFSALPGSASVQGNQTYGPYGNKLYNSGSMGTDKGFTGQYNDPLTGLDYYKARYYDPVAGRFLTADTVQGNMQGMDPYTYVGDNPETHNDPTGHCWPVCTMIAGAVIGGLVSGGMSIASQAMSGHGVNWGEVGKQAAVGAVTGAISGLAGPEAGLLVHSAVGAAAGAAGQAVSNVIDHKSIQDGVLEAAVSNGLMAGVGEAAGPLLQKATNGLKSVVGGVMKDATSTVAADAENAASTAAAGCGLSFASDTSVATPTGERPIGALQVGDQVQAYDVALHKATTQTVQKVFINHDNDLIDVTLAINTAAKPATEAPITTKHHDANVASHGSHAPPDRKETINTTEKHPWLTTNKGWVEAGALHIGDRVLRLDGTTATVVALKVVLGAQDMYDLTVSNVHTFAVGDEHFVVHNNSCFITNSGHAVGIYNDVKSTFKLEGTGFQLHHMIQFASVKSLGPNGLKFTETPVIALFGQATDETSEHGLATLIQKEANGVFRAKGIATIPYAVGRGVGRDGLLAAGLDKVSVDQVLNYADWFYSQYGTQLLKVPLRG